jgi:predicted N-acyltransferase
MEPDVWNSIVGHDKLICRHEYLQAIEQSQINDCRYFYPVMRDDAGTLMAHACFYYISTELDSFAKGLTKKTITGIRRIFPSFLILRSIECGTPVALGSTVSVREGFDSKIVLKSFAAEAERLAGELGVNVVLFRDFYDSDLAISDVLKALRYRTIYNLPAVRLRVRWPGFQAYLDDLRSSYRYTIRSRIKAFDKAGYSFRLIRDYREFTGDLARLWRNTYDHATEYRRELLEEPFFRQIQENLGNRSSVLLVEKSGVPVAFSILLDDDETLISLFSGLDYSCGKDSFLYFNLFYKTIELAIAGNKKEIDLGITTLEPKVEIGGDVARLTMYMKCTNRAWGWAVPGLFSLMTPCPKLPVRNIFKQGVPAHEAVSA